jgi:hypothetical protein
MKKNITLLVLLFIIIVLVGVVLALLPSQKAIAPTQNGQNQATTTPSVQKAGISDLITVDSPLPNAKISSPLTITGSARGNWYFEASAPVILTDWDGRIIAQGHIEAQDDWMTSDFVPFKATLTFTTPTAGDPAVNRGTLILKNDNPSGDPARDKAVEIPVVF